MDVRARRGSAGPSRPRTGLPTCLLGLMLVALLAGCTIPGAPAARKPPTTVAATRTPTPLATPDPTPLSMRQAWGNVNVRTLESYLGNNRAFVFDYAATPDGRYLVGINQPLDFLHNLEYHTGSPSYAVLRDVDTGQMITMQQLQTPESQILYAAADATWVAWAEVDDNPSFFDWTLFAYNMHTGQVRRLAQAVRGADGKPVPGPFSGPALSGDHVFWSQATAPITPQTLDKVVVRQLDLSTGATKTLASGAGDVNLAWPWLSWAQTTADGGGYIQLENLVTGQTVALQNKAAYVALCGTSLVYIDDPAEMYYIADFTRGTNNPQPITKSGFFLQDITVNDRLIAWDDNGNPAPGAQVFDMRFGRFVALPVTHGIPNSSWVGGHLLVWGDQHGYGSHGIPADLTFDIVDRHCRPTLSTHPPCRPRARSPRQCSPARTG